MKPIVAALALLLPLVALAAEWTARPLAELAVHPEYRALARVVATNEARLAAEVPGRIVVLPARVGEAVAKGAELARIDPASYRIALQQARAQANLVENRIRLAEAQLEQSRALAARGYLSADALRIKDTELAVLRSELNAARQGVAAAELDLRRTVIRAPYAGIVRERLASVGDLASAGTPLLVLAAAADTEVRARVPTGQIDDLKAAGKWRLAAGGESHPLALVRVSPVVEAAGQAQEVVFSAAEALAPGLAGELRWESPVAHLPAAYLQQRGGTLGAWLVRDGKPAFVALPGAELGRPAAVDWPPDTRVVDGGRFSLGLPAASGGAGVGSAQGGGR